MPYSDQQMAEIERDPARLKAYFCHMTLHWRRLAAQHRNDSRRGHVDGTDLVRWADTLERCADILTEYIDEFVAITVVKPPEKEEKSC